MATSLWGFKRDGKLDSNIFSSLKIVIWWWDYGYSLFFRSALVLFYGLFHKEVCVCVCVRGHVLTANGILHHSVFYLEKEKELGKLDLTLWVWRITEGWTSMSDLPWSSCGFCFSILFLELKQAALWQVNRSPVIGLPKKWTELDRKGHCSLTYPSLSPWSSSQQ